MTGATSGAGIAYPSGAPELTPRFQRGSCYAIFGLICNVIKIVVCPFFGDLLLVIVLSVVRITDSAYPVGSSNYS